MGRISKARSQKHKQAIDLIESDKDLHIEERDFVLSNYCPSAELDIGQFGMFFTPKELANEVTVFAEGRHVLDMCSGPGRLAFTHYRNRINSYESVRSVYTCIEKHPRLAEICTKIMGDHARVIHDSVYNLELLHSFENIDLVLSNPPYGLKIPDYADDLFAAVFNPQQLRYIKEAGRISSEHFIFLLAMFVTNNAFFLLPQGSAPFKYSATQCYSEQDNVTNRICSVLNIDYSCCSLDTNAYTNQWEDVSIVTEIVSFSMEKDDQQRFRAAICNNLLVSALQESFL